MKKQLLFTLALFWCSLFSFGQTFTDNGINYNVTSPTTVEVGINNGIIGDAIIPDTVLYNSDTYFVTNIGNQAFVNSLLTSIIIPNSVTNIGSQAFFQCSALTSIIIPNSVTNIEAEAFSHCSSLISIIIPNTVSAIKYQTFLDCTSLVSVTIPDSVISIEQNAFIGCISLTSIQIPDSVTTIGEAAFYFCTNLTDVTLPNTITSIQNSTFQQCSNLITINIPNTVTSIGDSAFSQCPNLTSIIIPEFVTSIGLNAFIQCSALTSVSIPNGVSIIKHQTFSGCTNLVSVIIPNSVTSIESYAFYGCIDLTLAAIPNSVISIGNNAFENCSSLTSVNIPNLITTISFSAFKGCSALISITIPNSVTSIGNNAFENCTALTSVTVDWASPLSIDSSVFSNIPFGFATLYVPAGTLAAYDAAPVWTNFNTITEICATPTIFDIASATGDCASPGVMVYLTGSETGVNYQLKRDGANVSGLVAGNGGQLNLGPQTVSGTYSAEAINNTGTCNILVNMNGSTVLNLNPISVGGNITGEATICANTTSGILTLENNIGTIQNWESTTSPFSVWTTIANTADTYSPGVLTETTQFRAISRSGNCNPADSAIATITVNASSDNTITVSNCGSYTWLHNGQTYTASGVYTGTTTNCVTEKLDLTVTTTPLPTRDMSINGTLCNGATIGTLISKFNNSANVTCYAGPSGGTALNASQLISPVNSNVTFYLTQTIAGCESARLTYNAYVNFVTPPNAAPTQNFCAGATVANLVATPGTSGGSPACCLNWFANSSGGAAIPSSTSLNSGVYYVGQNHISGCAIERTMVTVTINSGILSAPGANSTQIYAGSATIASLTATGTNLQWYANITGGTVLPTTTALIDGTIYYVSQSDLCGESTRTSVTVKKISEASQSFCDGATVGDLVVTPSSGQTVQWYSDAAGTMPVFGNTPLANGTYYVSQQTPSIVSTFAGSGTAGNVNATRIAAQFNRPRGVITDSQGNIFVTDYLNLAIRKIDPSGVVTTFATGFNLPHGISIDGLDNLYIGDSGSSRIRKITPLAVVTNVAGDGNQGDIDGPSNTAQFTNPAGVKFDSSGNIYVADVSNYKVRKISTTGDVTTLAGSISGYNDAQGNLAQFGYPSDVTTDSFGNVFIADLANNVIRKITPTGDVSTFAGSTAGYADGIGTAAQFNSPRGIAIDASNNLYVMDTNNRRVRKISPTGVVTTIAGIGTSGTTDGNGNVAQFGISWGLTVDANGIIYVADTNNNKIRKIVQASAPSNIVAVAVNIIQNTDNITTVSACDSYTWANTGQIITASGFYTGTTTNCVTEKLDLTITPLADNSVTQLGDTLTAAEIGATYQWVTCETNGSFTPINLATNQSYFVPSIGNYAVEVTKNGCTTRSACINLATLNASSFDTNEFKLYPNPTSDVIHISYNKEISEVIIYNLLGQTVLNQKCNALDVTLNLSQFPTNTYLMKVICGDNSHTLKIMKK